MKKNILALAFLATNMQAIGLFDTLKNVKTQIDTFSQYGQVKEAAYHTRYWIAPACVGYQLNNRLGTPGAMALAFGILGLECLANTSKELRDGNEQKQKLEQKVGFSSDLDPIKSNGNTPRINEEIISQINEAKKSYDQSLQKANENIQKGYAIATSRFITMTVLPTAALSTAAQFITSDSQKAINVGIITYCATTLARAAWTQIKLHKDMKAAQAQQ